MKLKTFINRIPMYYRSCIDPKGPTSINLKGPIGRGKTTAMTVYAPQLLSKHFEGEFGVVVINGPLLNPPDAVGYGVPQTVEREDRVRKHLMMQFTEPFWFLTKDSRHISEFKGGVIVVEEEDKMDLDVKKVIGECALSKRLGPHILPEGWVMWFTSNRAKDRSGSTKNYDHLINRQLIIELDDDAGGYEEYLMQQGVDPLFIHAARMNPDLVMAAELPTEQGPFCTPRSFEAAAFHCMMACEGKGKIELDDDLLEDVAGMIGKAGAAAVNASVMLAGEVPTFADIIKDPKKAHLPQRADAQILVCYQLASRVDEKTIDNVLVYIERMPKEYTITFGKNACFRNPDLINTKAFGDWTVRNSSLMLAIT